VKALYRKADFRRRNDVASYNALGEDEPWRSPFRRDYARLIHSPAFRRLQGKTQVIGITEADFFRNRLTHSIEVADIAKSIALRLNISEPYLNRHPLDLDLVETAALAHDLGHPPFGHTGEEILNELMQGKGGFEGNAQTVRILTCLEKKLEHDTNARGRAYPDNVAGERFGLNLTARAIGAIVKYNRRIPIRLGQPRLVKGFYNEDLEAVEFTRKMITGDPNAKDFRTVECSIMECADDIAYSTHDLDDAFKAGLINPIEFVSQDRDILSRVASKVRENSDLSGTTITDVVDVLFEFFEENITSNLLDLRQVPDDRILRETLVAAGEAFASADACITDGYSRGALKSRTVSKLLNGIVFRLDRDFPALSRVSFDGRTELVVAVLKNYVFEKVISSHRLKIVASRGKRIIGKLFKVLSDDKALLPEDVSSCLARGRGPGRSRVVCDYIACMTDRFALELYARLFTEGEISVFKPV
jgi:dGTPase